MTVTPFGSPVRSETRVFSPYSSPVDRHALMARTVLASGDRTFSDGAFVVLEGKQNTDSVELRVVLDDEALRQLIDAWRLTETDLQIVLIYEEKLLWDLELLVFPLSSLTVSEHGRELRVPIGPEIIAIAKAEKVTVRAYLALSRQIIRPVADAPSDRGAIVSAWSATLGAPEEQQWWEIKLLNDESLEFLNANRRIPVYRKALVFVETADLLESGQLSDGVTVYLNEGIAAQLQSSRTQTVVDAVSTFVASEVLSAILAGLRFELAQSDRSSPVPNDAAIMPFIKKIAGSLDLDVDQVLDLVRRDGEDLTALKSNLQRIVPLTDSVRKMLKGMSS